MSKEKELLYILCSILLKESELYKLFAISKTLVDIENYISKKAEKRDIELAKKNLRLLHSLSAHVISLFDEEYPEQLRDIYNAPPILYYVGSYLKEDRQALAIVGSRNLSDKGKILTELLINDISNYPITTVSGMAIGIDTIVHRESLNKGLRTIAVLGSGIDIIYPETNRGLFKKISENGAIFTEQPLGTKPFPYNFPKRNRIISGLSRGIVVVEAGERSGSLITARYGAEQNREVFTFPRTPLDKNSDGNNYLIKVGAKVITSGKDILEELFPDMAKDAKKERVYEYKLSPEELKILQLIEEEPVNIEKLCFSLDIGPPTLANFLLNLELKGFIKELPGKFYIKIKENK